MPRIWISPVEYALPGRMVLRLGGGSDLGATERRVSRTATLDGGCEVFDGGSTAADRIIQAELPGISREDSDRLAIWTALYPELVVTIEAGTFLAVPERYQIQSDGGRLRLLVKSKLSE